MDKPILSKQAFRDVDMDKIDYENGMLNLLERVIYRGSIEDIKALVNFYGEQKISNEIINSKCFGPKEVNFCCLLFKLKPTDFIYYKEGQFRAYPEFKNCPEDFEYPDFAWATFQVTS